MMVKKNRIDYAIADWKNMRLYKLIGMVVLNFGDQRSENQVS